MPIEPAPTSLDGGLRALLMLGGGRGADGDDDTVVGAPLPLPAHFSRCHSIHTQQDALLASRDLELIGAAVAALERAEAAVASAGVFSSNEDADDLATADVKYLLLPHYRAQLLVSAPVQAASTSGKGPGHGRQDAAEGGPTRGRLRIVHAAQRATEAFLARCEQYELLGSLARSVRLAMESSGGAMDAATKRSMKVEKFKQEKAINASISALLAARETSAAREQDAEEEGAGPHGGTAVGALDEEDERQLWQLRIELACLQALDTLAALQQEEELLAHAAAREAADGPRQANGHGAAAARDQARAEAERDAIMGQLRGVLTDLGGGKKQQMRADVFKPSHTLPTMTIEEAGRIEAEEAHHREAGQRRREEAEAARRAALDSDEEDAEDKAKQRGWDDFRDANPKGAGNSKIRPCG